MPTIDSPKYIPFARKYRPSNFSELMGQDVLVKTLSYCIENQRLSQTYLLTGIRGVGKTSSARIIAKTVNCTDLQIVDKQTLPCEKCQNCSSFNEHNHPDIIELDAASRTSIDDIREIIESCEYRPLMGKYKFFIIDEVHMLSKSAFNALLKIMEEPPEHVVFILATTEVQKIPLTVISRCQRYDLRRFGFNEVFTLLQKIAKKESLAIDDDALKVIASKSEGSARDAVSIMDQLASYSYKSEKKKKISLADVIEMLGVVGTPTILKFTKLIIGNSPKEAVALLHEVYFKSSNLEHFIQEMSGFIAELCKYKVINDYSNPLYSEYITEITDILLGISLSKLTTLWQIFNNGELEIKRAHSELLCAEMLVIKAIYACNLPKIEDILDVDAEIVDNNEQPAVLAKESKGGDIYDFLKYCHSNQALDVYYFLMNEVEVEKFTENCLELKGKDKGNYIGKIKNLLKDWSDEEWQVNHSKSEDFETMKESMLQKARDSEDFNLIKNYFPEANISDILLQKQ